MGSHRQGCGQARGHIKEKKSKHHITCRQTCVFPNLNKTCTCLCPPHLPTCAWMCVSHFFLLFFCLHLTHACLHLAAPVHASTHLCLVSCAYPCLLLAPNHAWPHLLWPPLPTCMHNKSGEWFFFFTLFNPPASMSPYTVPMPIPSALSLPPPTWLCLPAPVPAYLHISKVSSFFLSYFIPVLMFATHPCPCLPALCPHPSPAPK